MFYRIKENKIYDYADYKFEKDCLYTDICTMEEYCKNPEIFEIKDGVLIKAGNYNDILMQKRETEFKKEFFSTSLGFIRRQVTMKDGSTKDFLSDLLLPIKAGMELGEDVKIITYRTPDFSKDITQAYIKSLQEVKSATPDFIRECLKQTVTDFSGAENE